MAHMGAQIRCGGKGPLMSGARSDPMLESDAVAFGELPHCQAHDPIDRFPVERIDVAFEVTS